ncbi:sigma factor [Cyclobacterium salsum]|uniref:sigma factor n=1 Tax=Cyclobacterium salsum TaxID=2666329 RepID=UPI0021CFDB81|nr:sigma factor [Cyclobacterium salsum]
MTLQEFTKHFERSKPQLKLYLFRMTASIQNTEDIVQDTWIKASCNLASFNGQSSLKTF